MWTAYGRWCGFEQGSPLQSRAIPRRESAVYHQWPTLLASGCLGPEEQAGRHSIHSEHPLHALICCLQVLSSPHLETGPQDLWLAFRQEKLRGRLEDESQPLYCRLPQDHPSLSTTHPSSPSLSTFAGQSGLSCEATQTLIFDHLGHHVCLGLWWLHLTLKIG